MKTHRISLLVTDSVNVDRAKEPINGALSEEAVELISLPAVQAFEGVRAHEPVILFVLLSDHLDLDTLTELTSKVSNTPIILLDETPSYERVIDALRAGVADYFSFPVENNEAFGRSVSRQLYYSTVLSESQFYRDELEHSLAVLQEDQQAGHHVQQKVLPPDSQMLNGYQFSYSLKPSLYLSGDYVDYFRISESLTMFYLADISGHGASSAFVTVLLKNMSNRLLRNYMRGSSFDILSPTDVLSRINKELLDTGLGKHLTIFIGLLDSVENTLQYGVGGHFPMPILYQNGKADYIPGGGMPAGLFEEAEFNGRIIKLSDDFQLSIFSDGILEIMETKSLEEKETILLEACSKRYDGVSELLVSLGAVDSLEAPDDIALLSVSRAV